MSNIYQVEVFNSRIYTVTGETKEEAVIRARECNREETCAKVLKTKIILIEKC